MTDACLIDTPPLNVNKLTDAYIPSKLDDAGLDPYAFRLFCRIKRRWSQKKGCYESIRNMAKECGMSLKRARKAIAELEDLQMIVRTENAGDTDRFDPLPSTHWKPAKKKTRKKDGGGCKNDPTQTGDLSGVESASGGKNDPTVGAKTTPGVGAKTTPKGNPFKGDPLRDTQDPSLNPGGETPNPSSRKEKSLEEKDSAAPDFERPDFAPDLDQVKSVASMTGVPEEAAVKFFLYYESIGWKVGGNAPITNWRAKLAQWNQDRKVFEARDKRKDQRRDAGRGQDSLSYEAAREELIRKGEWK